MLNRRSFVGSSLATALGMHGAASAEHLSQESWDGSSGFEGAVASCHSLDCLGRPRSWSLVRDGYHPISPERVMVMMEKGGHGWRRRDSRLEVWLQESMSEPSELHATCRLPAGAFDLSPEKGDRCPACGYLVSNGSPRSVATERVPPW